MTHRKVLGIGLYLAMVCSQADASHVLVLAKSNSEYEYLAPGYKSAILKIVSEPKPGIILELDSHKIPINFDFSASRLIDIFSANLAVYSKNEKELLLIINCTNDDGEITGDIRFYINGYELGKHEINENCGL